MVGNGQLESASQAVGAEWENRDGVGIEVVVQAIDVQSDSDHNRAATALQERRKRAGVQQAQLEHLRIVGSIAEARERHASERDSTLEWAVEPQTLVTTVWSQGHRIVVPLPAARGELARLRMARPDFPEGLFLRSNLCYLSHDPPF